MSLEESLLMIIPQKESHVQDHFNPTEASSNSFEDKKNPASDRFNAGRDHRTIEQKCHDNGERSSRGSKALLL